MSNNEAGAGQLTEGQQLADFQIISVLGTGGMGVVYKATQRSLGRIVALKVLAMRPQHDRYRVRFERESRLAAALDHPNVVPVFDAGEDRRCPVHCHAYVSTARTCAL